MEAIIRTNDKNAFNSLVQFLKSLQFEVETQDVKKNKKIPSANINAESIEEISSLSETQFSKIWNNKSDAVYDRFLK